jgi:hypothetical protein
MMALILNFVVFIREMQCFMPPFLEERTSLRKDDPKQENYEELVYEEKTTIYTITAFIKKSDPFLLFEFS